MNIEAKPDGESLWLVILGNFMQVKKSSAVAPQLPANPIVKATRDFIQRIFFRHGLERAQGWRRDLLVCFHFAPWENSISPVYGKAMNFAAKED